jgi:hypothetical protein
MSITEQMRAATTVALRQARMLIDGAWVDSQPCTVRHVENLTMRSE